MTTISAAPNGSRCLVDTNVLLRLTQTVEEMPRQHLAIEDLLDHGNRLFTTFQNVAEFWNVSTRPLLQNGRGLAAGEVRKKVSLIELEFEILTEDRNTYHRWLDLLVQFKVSGRQVHDARLVAHMLEHNIPYLLTSNIKDFDRYPQIQLLDPEHWT